LLTDLLVVANSSLNINLAQEFAAAISAKKSEVASKEMLANTRYKDVTPYSDGTSIAKAIKGFACWGDTAFLQIYIPFVESVDWNQQPAIVVGVGDTEDCTTVAYKFEANGSITAFTIDEGYAKTHLVWVVSPNERVGNNGKFQGKNVVGDSLIHDGGVQDRTSGEIIFHIEGIYITDRKECWACGEADASIVGKAIDVNNCASIFKFDKKNFKNVSRLETFKWLDGSSTHTELVTDNSSPNVRPNWKVAYVWYEKDWSSPTTTSFNLCSTNVTWKSKDPAWAIESNYFSLWNDPGNNNFQFPPSFDYQNPVINFPEYNKIKFHWRKRP
jgi:hypothetical protein